jgi:hypothetical protein
MRRSRAAMSLHDLGRDREPNAFAAAIAIA